MRRILIASVTFGFLASGLLATAAELTPVPVAAGVAKLSPDNSKIQFVGTHVGAKPDPRTGGFAKFSGQVQVDSSAKTLKTVSIDIDTSSLWTEIPMLTTHLKSADFFEVRQHPAAKFTSTKITASEGKSQITGNLTLHGVTKELTFPAAVQIGERGLTLSSEFSIDRSDFGMTFGPDKVVNKVTLTVVVGEKTQPK
jgi:polyisoprenoid-binding protein YceI